MTVKTAKLVKYVAVGHFLLKSMPAMQRAIRQSRPLWNQVNKKTFWTKRDTTAGVSGRTSEFSGYGNSSCGQGRTRAMRNEDAEAMWKMTERFVRHRYEAVFGRPPPRTFTGETLKLSEVVEMRFDNNGYLVKLDVQGFKSADIDIQLTGSTLKIRGKQESESDKHGLASRAFTRELTLPEDVDLNTLETTLSEEGYLIIKAALNGDKSVQHKNIVIQRSDL